MDNYYIAIKMNQNAIDPANTLESNNDMPPVTMSEQDPLFVYKVNNKEDFEQRYAVLSFISPRDLHKDFELFAIHAFFKSYMNSKLNTSIQLAMNYFQNKFRDSLGSYIHDLDTVRDTTEDPQEKELTTKLIAKLNNAMNVICEIDPINNNSVVESYKKELEDPTFSDYNDTYQQFVEDNKEKLFEAYNNSVDYQGPNTCAVKVLGVFESVEKATEYAKDRFIPTNPYNNMFIGEVGKWHAWSSDYSECENTQYMNESLQKMMDQYKKNMVKRNEDFEHRRKEGLKANENSKVNSIREKYANNSNE